MNKHSKLYLTTLCFISSVSAFADGYKGEAPPLVPVSIPSFAGGFEFTLGAIYMTPNTSNLDYLGASYSGAEGINSIVENVSFAVHPGYNWGFLLGLGYVFPNTANDVKLDWMYFHNDFKSSEFLVGEDQSLVFMPAFDPPLFGNQILNAVGKVQYDFDAVDLTFGQYLNVGSRLQTRLFTGLRYMRLNDDLSTDYAIRTDRELSTDPIENIFADGSVNSSFNGLGPLVGIKADYYLGAGWSLSGAIDGALLVGQLSLNANGQMAIFSQSGATAPYILAEAIQVDYAYDSQNVIAPGYDAKFGLNYKYQFNNGTLLGFELGYQVTKYIDVVEQISGADEAKPILSLTQQIQGADRRDVDVTNFRLAGPYLTMNVKI